MSKKRVSIHEVPEGMRVVVNHLHQGNSSRNARHGKDYVTVARLFDDDEVVTTGYAYCSRNDTPSRKTGREIAVGRCLVEFYQPIGVITYGEED